MSSVVSEQVGKRVPPTGTREWWLLYLFGPLLVFGTGLLLAPELVYDRFVWQYLWGPVIADATGRPVTHEGITAVAGYNPINTVTYLAIVLYSLPGLRAFLQHYEIDLDTRLAYGFAPLIVAGGTMRAFEDAQLLPSSLDVLFITPSIYFVMAGIALVSLIVGVVLRERDIVSLPVTVAGLGLGWALGAIGWVILYGFTAAETFRPIVPVLTTSIALLVTGVFYAAGAIPALAVVRHPMYLLVIFGQMWDAAQNLVGVTLFGYEPKLFITKTVYEWTDFAGSTFVLKLLAVTAVVWVLADGEGEMDHTWWWLIGFVAMAVGLPMGIRGSIRMMLGV
jgi:uncharacterized membrane protein